jgi:WD40 repeat protein
MCFAAKGSQLVLAIDTALEVRDLVTGAEVMTLGAHRNQNPAVGHTEWISGFALAEEAGVAVSVARDRTLRVWDLASGLCRRAVPVSGDHAGEVALSSDGRLAVSLHRYEIYAWDLESGECWPLLPGQARGYECPTSVALANARSGQRLALLARHGPEQDPTRSIVSLIDLSSGNPLRVLHDGFVVSAVSLSADGRLAATADWQERTVRVWEVSSGRCMHVLRGHMDNVTAIALTSDGCLLVSAGRDGVLRVWTTDTGECVRALPAHPAGVARLCLTRNGALAATSGLGKTGETKRIVVWDLARGMEVPDAERHLCPVTSVALSSDGRRAASASLAIALKGRPEPLADPYPIRLWDPATGACVERLAHDPREPVDVSFEGSALRLVPTRQLVSEITGIPTRIRAPDDGPEVAGAGGAVRIYPPTRGWTDPTLVVENTETGARLASYCAGSAVTALSPVGADGRFACGTRDGEVHFLRLIGFPSFLTEPGQGLP